jgi:sulfoxide reductase catalytic subunit YedY
VRRSAAMRIEPWTVAVEGAVRRPKLYGVDELLRLAPLEERVCRHRCVGGWYMVVPWVGYSLAELIRRVEPTGNAKYVEFTSHWDAAIMGNAYYQFPYIESLRLDEAQHPLTLLGFGHHGRVLPKQNGAPLRIVTPWKFAHKSPKAIVRIRFTEQQPAAFFHTQYKHLYGWYRNVHPELAQNGSQRHEKRVGEWFKRRDTPLLNGYADQVAGLYGDQLHSLR